MIFCTFKRFSCFIYKLSKGDFTFFIDSTKNVYFSDQLRELPERTGLIFICRDNTPADILILSQTAFYNLGQFFLSGRTIYNVFYEK